MSFTGSLFQFTSYLQAPFFDCHVIYRLPFSIYTLFTGSLFRFACFFGSLFLFPCYLQAPFFDFHVICRLLFSFSMLFTPTFFYLHVVYSPPFFLLTCYLQYFGNLPSIKFRCYLRVSRLNHKKFTGYLQYLQEQFTCNLHHLSPLLWNIYSVFSIIYMFHLKYLHVFYMEPPKHVKGEKSCKLFFTLSFWLFTC